MSSSDTHAYREAFLSGSRWYWEYGYTALIRISALMFGDVYQLFFGLIAVINLTIAFISAKKLKYRIIPFVLLYIAVIGLLSSYANLRQGLAISFALLAYSFFARNPSPTDKLLAVLFVSVAIIFHISAIFILVLWAFSYVKIPTNKNFFIAVLVFLIAALYVDLYSQLYNAILAIGNRLGIPNLHYLRPNSDGRRYLTTLAFPLLLFFVVLWIIKHKDIQDIAEEKAFRVVFISVVLLIFFQNFLLFNRLFFFSLLLFIPPVIVYEKKCKYGFAVFPILTFAFILYFIQYIVSASSGLYF